MMGMIEAGARVILRKALHRVDVFAMPGTPVDRLMEIVSFHSVITAVPVEEEASRWVAAAIAGGEVPCDNGMRKRTREESNLMIRQAQYVLELARKEGL